MPSDHAVRTNAFFSALDLAETVADEGKVVSALKQIVQHGNDNQKNLAMQMLEKLRPENSGRGLSRQKPAARLAF